MYKKMKQKIIQELELYTLILLDMASNVLSHLISCVAISERPKDNKHKYMYNYGKQKAKVMRAIKNVYLREN